MPDKYEEFQTIPLGTPAEVERFNAEISGPQGFEKKAKPGDTIRIRKPVAKFTKFRERPEYREVW